MFPSLSAVTAVAAVGAGPIELNVWIQSMSPGCVVSADSASEPMIRPALTHASVMRVLRVFMVPPRPRAYTALPRPTCLN
jgi:hypothetical protein